MTRHTSRRSLLLVLLAALSVQLTGCSDDPPQATEPSTNSPSTEATPSTAPTWTLLADAPDDVPLQAGEYGLIPNGVSGKVAVVRAPTGYMRFGGGWTFITGEPFRAMGFLTADRVFSDPCGSQVRPKEETLVDPGPTVEDLAAALAAQEAVTTSAPRAVTVDGYDGLYLDYQMSEDINLAECGDQAFDIFNTGSGFWFLDIPRERAAIWILDVDGERLVLSWVAGPEVTEAHLQEMTDMVKSTHFVDGE